MYKIHFYYGFDILLNSIIPLTFLQNNDIDDPHSMAQSQSFRKHYQVELVY